MTPQVPNVPVDTRDALAVPLSATQLEDPNRDNPFAQLIEDQSIAVIPSFELECGRTVHSVPIAYKTWGTLNEARNNVMVICHALTGSSDVMDWWGPLLGSGKAFDTDQFFIVCCNVTGSPYGSMSPCTINPDTHKPYGPSFPMTTIRDDIRLHRRILDMLGVRQVAICIGGSLGGMQVMEWATLGSDYVRHIVPIATSARHSAWGISWGEAQRQAIYSDPDYCDGLYPIRSQPASGLSAARMSALLTYRTRNSFQSRFGRNLMQTIDDRTGNNVYSAQSYLRYQGKKFIQRFDANCYVALTLKMDSHDISRGRDDVEEFHDILKSLQQPALVIGIESDGLFTINEQYEISEHLPNATMVAIQSPDGHDGFLLEFTQLNALIRQFIQKHLPEYYAESPGHAEPEPLVATKSSLFGEAEVDVMKW